MTRVLVVDDKEENLYYLQTLLGAKGHQVELARHGAEALFKARQAPPELIISDLLMPVMDGYTLLRHWRADQRLKSIPFIVYTATYTEPEDERLALSLGADAFILKPSEPNDFLGKVAQVMGRGSGTKDAPPPPTDPAGVFREYSETLIRKLEEKTLQLEESNRSLQKDVAARLQIEAQLRESEERFRILTDAMPQLVWVAKADGTNTYVNRRWVEYTGLDLAKSAAGGWAQVQHPDDQARNREAWAEAAQSGGVLSVETRLKQSDGSYRWWLVRAVPLRGDDGAISKWFGTCTDIQELKDAEANLRKAEEQLRLAQKIEAVGLLAGGVAHDFNNLLSVVLSYAELVLDDLPEGSPMRHDLEQIRRAGTRATALTRQLLAFGRRQVMKPSILELGKVVQDMAPMLRRILGGGVNLSLMAPTGIGQVYADAHQVEQIVMNLVVNARDAMPGGGHLSVEVGRLELKSGDPTAPPDVPPGSYVMLRDQRHRGAAWNAATRARIFEPFFTTKGTGKGTGLGLSTVYGIVQQSHGHIWVLQRTGRSTVHDVTAGLPADGSTATVEPAPGDRPQRRPRCARPRDRVPDRRRRTGPGGHEPRTILRRHGYHRPRRPQRRRGPVGCASSTSGPIHLPWSPTW
jgi:two-component system cell cycle sensor histidine kinase/response regulator CckA